MVIDEWRWMLDVGTVTSFAFFVYAKANWMRQNSFGA